MRPKEILIRFRSFWIFPLLAVLGLLLSHSYSNARMSSLLWLFPSGLVAWTLVEYVLHRFIFHAEGRKTALQRLLSADHLQHHAVPRDTAHILVHTGPAMAWSALVGLAFLLATQNLFWTFGFLSGIWAG